jgi:membrane dipeptidase
LSWTITPDISFLGFINGGVSQARIPAPGELKAAYERQLAHVMRAVAGNGVQIVKTAEDIQKAAQGVPSIALTSEGADFLEGKLDSLSQVHEQGIRHLQLVHYIKSPVGDLQTERPEHGGLTDFGRQLVGALNQQGILIDLAHSTSESIDHALSASKVPMIWSHSYVTEAASSWNASGYRSRALALKDAKKIADAGGAVGLWSLGASFGGGIDAYAAEIIRMINWLGADHVMFGSDQDGLPQGAVIQKLTDLRSVVEALAKRGLDEKTLRAVAFDNYARCLKTAMMGT